MPLSSQQLESILTKLDTYSSTPAELILSLLQSPDHVDHDAVHDIHHNTNQILESLAKNPGTSEESLRWAYETTKKTCELQICKLAEKHSGQQFSARHATAENLKDFDIHTLAEQMRTTAPHVWQLLDALLSVDTNSKAQRDFILEKRRQRRADAHRHDPEIPNK